MKTIIQLTLYLFLSVSGFAQYSWSEITPVVGNYYDINFIDNTTGFIAGKSSSNTGVFLITIDAGETWQSANITGNHSFLAFLSIDFVSETIGFVSAYTIDSAFILKTTDKGGSWNPIYCGTRLVITQMDFINETSGYGVAQIPASSFYVSGYNDYFIKMTESGAEIDTFNFKDEEITSYNNPEKIISIGSNELIAWYSNDDLVYKIENESVLSKINITGNGLLYDIEFFNSENGVALVEMNGIYTSIDNGSSWSNTYNTYENIFYDVYPYNNDYIITIGRSVDPIYFTTQPGALFISRDGGMSWDEQEFNEYITLNKAAFADTNNQFFIGDFNNSVFRRKFNSDNIHITLPDEFTMHCHDTIFLNPGIDYYGTDTLSYTWEPSIGLSDNSVANPVLTSGYSRMYYLTISDGKNSVRDSVYIDLEPYNAPDLCFVNVDPLNNMNIINFEPDTNVPVLYYQIYRREYGTEENVDIKITSLTDTTDGKYTDVFSFPDSNYFGYALSFTDECGINTDTGKYINSLFLKSAEKTDDINLVWNSTNNQNDIEYIVYRGVNSINLEPIDTLDILDTAYSINSAENGKMYYQIIAISTSCSPEITNPDVDYVMAASNIERLRNYSLVPTIAVEHNQSPSLNIITNNNINLCYDDKVLLDTLFRINEDAEYKHNWAYISTPDVPLDNNIFTLSTNSELLLTITDTNNCIYYDTLNIIIDPFCETHTENPLVRKDNIRIYPNPNNGSFFIQFNNRAGEYQLKVFNTSGQIIYTKAIFVDSDSVKEQITFNVTPGIYYLTIQSEKVNTIFLQFIIEK